MVKVFSDGKVIAEADENYGETISDFLGRQRVGLFMPCGGNGACGKCRVAVKGNHSNDGKLPDSDLFLACKTRLLGDAEITLIGAKYAFESNSFKKRLSGEPLGIAVDIGTTTVFCELIGLVSKRILDKCAFVNPQVQFGSDVISRIGAASQKPILEKLTEAIRTELSERLEALTANEDSNNVELISVCGNPVMEYLFCRKDPAAIGAYPFEIEDISGEYPASDFSLGFKNARVIINKNLSAFFGADALSGSALLLERDGDMLLDLGTNGEICFLKNGIYYYCSAAAGPAFEGACLSCGMAASDGAIYKMSITDGRISSEIIGGGTPLGFCGSGIVDALAVMLKCGICTPDGRLNDENLSEAISKKIKTIASQKYFCPVDGSNAGINGADIRMLQLAKSAIGTALTLCCEAAGGSTGDIGRLFLSGGFGEKINIESATICGIIPRSLRNKCISAGNSSLSGAAARIISPDFVSKLKTVIDNSYFVDLNDIDKFNDMFTDNLYFGEQKDGM